MELQTQPYSSDAETALLAAIIERNSLVDDLEHLLNADYFYSHQNQILYRRLSAMAFVGQPIDAPTLVASLEAANELHDAGGIDYIVEVISCGRGHQNARHYAQIVMDRWLQRQLIAKGQQIVGLGYESESAKDAIQEAQSLIMDFDHSPAGEVPSLNQQLRAMIDKIDYLMQNRGKITGLATGFIDLDKRLFGLQKADLVIVAGRPGSGKTTLAMNIAERAALSGKSVLVFSLEMPSDQLLIRAACSIGKMDHEKVKRGELDDHELAGLTGSVARLKDKNMIIDDRPMLTSEQAMSRARKFQRKLNAPLELIVVDYIQLMNDKGQEIDRITNITRNLKLMAKSMNCPVIALSQLNRDCDKRVNARPIMSDLRSSGSIEQDADIIAFVYRDEMYHKDTKDKGVAEIIIGKFRNGQPGTVFLAARLDQSRFDNLVGYTSAQSNDTSYGGFNYNNEG